MDSYNDILARMVESYTGYSGSAPSPESDIMIRLRVLAGEIYEARVNAEYIKRQIFASTATGEYLDRHAAERGLSRKAATCASGRVYFFAQQMDHDDILIPAGTEVCSPSDRLRFTTIGDSVIEAGDECVSVRVAAAAPGAAGNARVGAVTVLVTPVIGVGRVSNTNPFSGGADAESDDELRARVIDSYVNISNGANAAYYKGIALSVDGVYSASVVGRGRGNGTVDVYISGRGTQASAAVKQRVQALLNEGRELNVDVLARDPSAVEVTLYIRLAVEDGYDFSSVAEQTRSAVSGYIASLGIGADVLLSRIGEVIRSVGGVRDYHFVESYGSDRTIDDNAYAVAGTITIREA